MSTQLGLLFFYFLADILKYIALLSLIFLFMKLFKSFITPNRHI
jgi:hypothetical protein